MNVLVGFPFYCEDWLSGTRDLTPEERGVYITVVVLIYRAEGNLLDNDQDIARWCNCDVRVWRRIKATLETRGKLFCREGTLRNPKADRVLPKAIAKALSQRVKGQLGGLARATTNKSVKPKNIKNSTINAQPQGPLQGELTDSSPKGAPSAKKEKESYFGSKSERSSQEEKSSPQPSGGSLATALPVGALREPPNVEPEEPPEEPPKKRDETIPISEELLVLETRKLKRA